MRRWETLAAIAAVVCAVIGATRLGAHAVFTYLAIGLIAVVALARLQAALANRRPAPSGAAERARKIRAQRGTR